MKLLKFLNFFDIGAGSLTQGLGNSIRNEPAGIFLINQKYERSEELFKKSKDAGRSPCPCKGAHCAVDQEGL